jgi:hypothetical protein
LGELAPVIGGIEGMNERAGTQAVYVKGCVGQELTLLLATVIVLESLGGIPTPGISKNYRDSYGRRVTVVEIRRRRRGVEWQMASLSALSVVVMILSSPIWIVWTLIKMPWEIRRATRIARSFEERTGQRE